MKLQLDIGGDDGVVEVGVGSMDEFHPDELYDRLDIFSRLSGLRRQLTNSATFAKAAKEVQSWLGRAGRRPNASGSRSGNPAAQPWRPIAS